ncbi:MAG: polymer-forming cytoskeletal protein [Thermorudis peleae]|nr:polymer-forming cytoskeletal protein [Thermorudis peleae]
MAYEQNLPLRSTRENTMPESLSLVDRYTVIEGTLTTSRDIRIEGELRGTLRSEGAVHIAEGATVEATIEATHITVAGTLRGTISCRGKLSILNTGRVNGTITTQLLVIQEGGRCEGEIHMDTGAGAALPHTQAQRSTGSRNARPLPNEGTTRLPSLEDTPLHANETNLLKDRRSV